MSAPATEFERVYTVHDYWDGARRGFAEFEGRPHAYRAVRFYNRGTPEDDHFDLSPIDPSLLPLVLEEWDIWLRWQAAFRAGNATEETHPALPEDRRHYEGIHPTVQRCLAVLARRAIRVRATFSEDGTRVHWERIAQPKRARRERPRAPVHASCRGARGQPRSRCDDRKHELPAPCMPRDDPDRPRGRVR